MADYGVVLVSPADLVYTVNAIDDYDIPVALVDATDLVHTVNAIDDYDIPVALVDPADLIYEFSMSGGGSEQTVVNRVWDTVAGDFVRWVTAGADSGGASYPGPGTFGVDTSDYVVETVKYARV